MLAAISAAVATVAAIAAALQLTMMRRVSRAGISSEAISSFWSDASRRRRRIVWGLEHKPFEHWSQAELDAADEVATELSRMGLLIKHGYADRDTFLAFYGVWCRRSFEILAPLVARRRTEFGAPDQWIYFEWLARTADKHNKRTQWWEGRAWRRLKAATHDLDVPTEPPRKAPDLPQAAG